MSYPDQLEQHPATPHNNGNNPDSPRAPVRNRVDVQRHPLSPLPASTSNFLLDQNNLPPLPLQSPHVISHGQRPHTLPSHFPQPQFTQPSHSQFYSQQPYERQYFPSHNQYFYPPPPFVSHHSNPVPYPVPLPSHNLNNVHLSSHNLNTVPFPTATLPTSSPSVPSTAPTPKALPSTSHIPLLSGRSDFNAWNNGIRSLILYIGYTGHIASQPAPGIAPLPDRIPSYPPALSVAPSPAELAHSRAWWEEDHVVSHILTSRLTAGVLSILPFNDDDEAVTPRTARKVYDLLRQLYSVHDYTSSSALYSELCNLQCGGRVLDYVTRWRAGIAQLRAARFNVSFCMVIERFLDRLPTSVPYDILRFRTMENINNIAVDDIAAFIKLTDEVLRIDSTYRRASNTQSIPTRSMSSVPPTTTSLPSSSSTVAAIKPSQSRSSIICSNCGLPGHSVDKCFKTGGGLEGKRDQYLASRTRIQAHLAQITELIDSNLIEEPDPPCTSLDTATPDVIVDTVPSPSPTIAALSIADVDTSIINDDFYFGCYIQGDHKTSFAFSTFPSCPIFPEPPTSVSTPTALAVSPFPFNSLFDSGCTNHIFRDRGVSWTYDSTLATPVKTANCGFLNTLARGSVYFQIKSNGRSAVFVLKDCLHAPDAPINLISVSAMTEKGATFTFAPGLTSISFPTSLSSYPNFTFNATVSHRLSFFNCDFVLLPSSESQSSPAVPSVLADPDTALLASFPHVPLTPDLWH